MRFACTLAVSLVLVGPALAHGDQPGSDTSQQGGAVRAMGRVGSGRTAAQKGIEIPNYDGDVSAVRRLPIGTTPPRSRSFVRAPSDYGRHYYVSGQFDPSLTIAWP